VVVVDQERLKHSKTSFGKLVFEVAEKTATKCVDAVSSGV